MNNDIQKLLDYAKTLEWQPIETAPHNRKVFVKYKNCANKDRIVKACFYAAGTLQAHDDYDGDDVDDNGYMTTSKWYEECENNPDGFIYELEETPTHWIPLPDGNAGAVILELVGQLDRFARMLPSGNLMNHYNGNSLGNDMARQALAKAAALIGGNDE